MAISQEEHGKIIEECGQPIFESEGPFLRARELEARVKRLERQNRRWKIGGIAAVAALAFSLAATAWAQQRNAMPFRTPTVEAEHFVLKDASGVTRGEFTMTANGPVLQLFGPGGRVIWSTRGGARPATDGE
jgi:ferric-dicitrate binding protein FerR (iron transport regulator)